MEILNKPTMIRNMIVIADGKSSIVDLVVAAASGVAAADEPAEISYLEETHARSAERGAAVKSAGVSLHYHLGIEDLPDERMPKDSAGRDFWINLINSPCHVDIFADAIAVLRVADGALLVVDCIEGKTFVSPLRVSVFCL